MEACQSFSKVEQEFRKGKHGILLKEISICCAYISMHISLGDPEAFLVCWIQLLSRVLKYKVKYTLRYQGF